MNYRIIAIVIVVFITACNTKNKESEGVSSNDLGIDTINFVGMHLNKSIIYVDFNNDTIHPFDELLKNEVKHNLILYFHEMMCSSCIVDALRFLKSKADIIPLSITRIVVGYNNIRRPAILLKLNEVDIPFCNIGLNPLLNGTEQLEKPVFLVIGNDGVITSYFQLKDNMEERMNKSLRIISKM